MKRILVAVLVALLLIGGLLLVFLEPIRRAAVVVLSDDYAVDAASVPAPTVVEGKQQIDLKERVRGLEQPTEIGFVPGQGQVAIVLQRQGEAIWVDLGLGERGPFLSIDVLTRSEQGLLGLAFHPEFATNGRFFLNYVARRGGKATTVVEEWRVPAGADVKTAVPVAHEVLLLVQQPYANHNGGQVLFGPDGKLYVPLGDGGLKDDIHGHGQDRSTLLGSIVRLDVDKPAPHIPDDNPFVGQDGVRPEIWAWGVRNPWRSTFTPDGRLIVADVGQNAWEEVGFARAGASLGWNTWEGLHCFPPGTPCEEGQHIPPFWEYQHPIGTSITGGLVYQGSAVPALTGQYIVGDFVSGRLWAVPVPASGDGPVDGAQALGKFDFYPVTFTAAPDGEILVADYGRGRILQIVPAQ